MKHIVLLPFLLCGWLTGADAGPGEPKSTQSATTSAVPTFWQPVTTPDGPAAWCPDSSRIPPDLLTVRPIADPHAPDATRKPAFRILDDQPKVLIICGGKNINTGGQSGLTSLITTYYQRRNASCPLTIEAITDAERAPGFTWDSYAAKTPKEGAAAWADPTTNRIRAAKQRGLPVVTLTALPPYAFGMRTIVEAASIDPTDRTAINAGADGILHYCSIQRAAGADLVIFANAPSGAKPFAKPSEFPPTPPTGRRCRTPDQWEWLIFAEVQRRAVDGVFWGPNYLAMIKDRPDLMNVDGRHLAGPAKTALVHLLMIHLLRLDGSEVPVWCTEALSKALAVKP